VFNIAAFAQECAAPPPWTNITSVTSPNYTSIDIISPPAGFVASDSQADLVMVWNYRDQRNFGDAGIGSLFFTIFNVKNNDTVGQGTWANGDGGSLPISFIGSVRTAGTYRVLANYTSSFEGSPPGSPVITYSEEFFISGPDGGCDGIGSTIKIPNPFKSGAEPKWRVDRLPFTVFICFTFSLFVASIGFL
jgi:hypothetical protein